VDIVFSKVTSLGSLSLVHNLITLTLINTQTGSLSGIEATGHSLETLDVVMCGL